MDTQLTGRDGFYLGGITLIILLLGGVLAMQILQPRTIPVRVPDAVTVQGTVSLPPSKWEYKWERFLPEDFLKDYDRMIQFHAELNKLGIEGWEIICVIPEVNRSYRADTYILKRSVK